MLLDQAVYHIEHLHLGISDAPAHAAVAVAAVWPWRKPLAALRPDRYGCLFPGPLDVAVSMPSSSGRPGRAKV